MNVLLVLNNENAKDTRLLVELQDKKLKERVADLLLEDKGREAFNLITLEAEIKAYLPHGMKSPVKPEVTLIEDML